MCDHTVGYLHEFVVQSELKSKLDSEAYGWNSHSKTINALNVKSNGQRKEDYKPIDFLDRRKGYMTMFNHCPYCGEKINWKDIKKAI